MNLHLKNNRDSSLLFSSIVLLKQSTNHQFGYKLQHLNLPVKSLIVPAFPPYSLGSADIGMDFESILSSVETYS